MKTQYLASFFALAAFANLQCVAQESDRAYPFLEKLEVFSGTFEGTAVLPKGIAASERLGEVEGKTVTIIETSRWAPGKCAQIVDSSYKIDGTETILGTMLIGWDQNKQAMMTTLFTTHKGVWTGTAKLEGDKWVFQYEGYNLDGKKVTGKRVITFKDEDNYNLVETTVREGEPQPKVTWQFKRL